MGGGLNVLRTNVVASERWSLYYLIHAQSYLQVKVFGKMPVSIANAKHPLHGLKYPKQLAVGTDDLPQCEAKLLCPPGCHVWRANYHGAWQFHLPGHKRCSEAWSSHGGSSRKAMLAGMQKVWTLFNKAKGLPEKYCPVTGVF